MPRMNRILNITITSADTWQKVFDEASYSKNRIREVRMKLRETTTADYFRYNYDGGLVYMTSTTGLITLRDVPKIYVWVPSVSSQVIELEIIYE